LFPSHDRRGNVDVRPIVEMNTSAFAYVAKYVDKVKRKKRHAREDWLKCFSHMSKGIGKAYIDRCKQWHLDDVTRNYVVLNGGYRKPLPKYYRDRIYDDEQKKEQRTIIERAEIKNQVADMLGFFRLHPNADFVTYDRCTNDNKLSYILKHERAVRNKKRDLNGIQDKKLIQRKTRSRL